MRLMRLITWLLSFALVTGVTRADANEVQVAVAANFAAPFQRIVAEFEKETKHHAVVVAGATGVLYAQIRNGGPFEVLLAADTATPRKLESDGLAVRGSRFTYAVGKLVLWSAKPDFVDSGGEVLRKGHFRYLAIANPQIAPYGAAAVEVIDALGLSAVLRPQLLTGESIAQAAQFVATGNAELGFVALSQVAVPGQPVIGSYWRVPQRLYSPIRQDAALLQRGASSPAALALVAYLKGAKARDLIRAYGYDLE